MQLPSPAIRDKKESFHMLGTSFLVEGRLKDYLQDPGEIMQTKHHLGHHGPSKTRRLLYSHPQKDASAFISLTGTKLE